MKMLPVARRSNIVVQELGRELLIYDLKTHQAYQLNEISMIVFQACDGRQTIDDLKRKFKFSDDVIYFAIDELKNNNLIDGKTSNRFGNLSRREVIKRVGLASMVALPVVAGLVAPTAAQAQSGTCATSGTCNCRFTANTLAGTSCSVTDPIYTGTCSQTGPTACVSCVSIANCIANNLCQGMCSPT